MATANGRRSQAAVTRSIALPQGSGDSDRSLRAKFAITLDFERDNRHQKKLGLLKTNNQFDAEEINSLR